MIQLKGLLKSIFRFHSYDKGKKLLSIKSGSGFSPHISMLACYGGINYTCLGGSWSKKKSLGIPDIDITCMIVSSNYVSQKFLGQVNQRHAVLGTMPDNNDSCFMSTINPAEELNVKRLSAGPEVIR